MSQPTVEAIQTLLIIGNVLSYNMNPGVAYVLLGKGAPFLSMPSSPRRSCGLTMSKA